MNQIKKWISGIIISALIYIYIIPSDPEELKLVFKVIPIALIMSLVAQFPASTYKKRILMGLACCMIGDVAIRWFVVGLSAFLIGHIFYISAFVGRRRDSRATLSSTIALMAYTLWLGHRLLASISESSPALMAPVLLYIGTIAIMCWMAILTRQSRAILGAILFVISDSILAWNQFITPLPFSESLIMITYYSGQFFIANSVHQHTQTGPSIHEMPT